MNSRVRALAPRILLALCVVASTVALAPVASARIIKVEGPFGPVYKNIPEPASRIVVRPGSKRSRAFLPIIAAAAERHGVPAALVEAVVACESNFDPKAVSHAGAEGLMQLMPATARSHGLHDSFDVNGNIDTGTKHLAGLLKSFQGNRRLAIAAYNAGEGAVRRAGGIPAYPETRRYVKKVEAYISSHPSVLRPSSKLTRARTGSSSIRMTRDRNGRLLLTNLPKGSRPVQSSTGP